MSSTGAAAQPTRRILLAHGLLGFSKIGPASYFNGVEKYFDPGCAFITPSVAPAGSIADRAGQLEKAILDQVPKDDLDRGAAIHIVAHSMGGLDARYLISPAGLNRAQWFASLTTISTPHHGSPLADVITGSATLGLSDLLCLVELPEETLAAIVESLSKSAPALVPLSVFVPQAILDTLKDGEGYCARLLGTPPDAFRELTTAFTSGFNTRYPSLEGVPLLCYAGNSSPDQTMCRALFASWAYLRCKTGDNDGVVPYSSSIWGGNVRAVPADHFEEVGWGSLFDGPLPRQHFPIGGLYGDINLWQRGLAASP